MLEPSVTLNFDIYDHKTWSIHPCFKMYQCWNYGENKQNTFSRYCVNNVWNVRTDAWTNSQTTWTHKASGHHVGKGIETDNVNKLKKTLVPSVCDYTYQHISKILCWNMPRFQRTVLVNVQLRWSTRVLLEKSDWRWTQRVPHVHLCMLVQWRLPNEEDSAAEKCDKRDAGHDELTVTCGHTPRMNEEETVHHIASEGWHYDCNINDTDEWLISFVCNAAFLLRRFRYVPWSSSYKDINII